MNIRKINPNAINVKPPASRGSSNRIIGGGLKPTLEDSYHTIGEPRRSLVTPEYMSGEQSAMSGHTIGVSKQLPALHNVQGAMSRRPTKGSI